MKDRKERRKMKALTGNVFLKSIQGVLEITLFFPIFLSVGIMIVPTQRIWMWLVSLPLYYLVGILIRSVGKRKRRIMQSLLVMILVMLLITPFIAPHVLWQQAIYFCILFIAGWLMLCRGLALADNEWRTIFGTGPIYIGLIIHGVALFLFWRIPLLESYVPILVYSNIAAFIIALIRLNRLHLQDAVLSTDKKPVVPLGVLKFNSLLLGGVILFMMVLASWKQFIDAIRWIVGSIFVMIFRAMNWLMNLLIFETPGEQPMEEQAPDFIPPLNSEEYQANPFWEMVIQIVGYMILIGIVIALLYLIFRVVYKIGRWLWEYFLNIIQTKSDALQEGTYVDEKEMLLDWEKTRKKYAQKLKDWLTKREACEKNWEELQSNAERIRYLYRKWIRQCISKGYAYKNHLTPTQIQQDIQSWSGEGDAKKEELIKTYQDTRYGKRNVEDDTVKRFSQQS